MRGAAAFGGSIVITHHCWQKDEHAKSRAHFLLPKMMPAQRQAMPAKRGAWARGGGSVLATLLLVLAVAMRVRERPAQVALADFAADPLLGGGGTGTKVAWQPLRPYHPSYYPDQIQLYAGPETPLYGHSNAILNFKGILRQNHPGTEVKTFASLRTASLRAATWDEDAHALVFPPFTEYPDLHMISKTDLRGYASGGNTIVFMGGFGSIAVMNEIFGWQIRPVPYQDGPFYRSKRNAHNTVFAGMPSLLETGRSPVYGVHMGTLPPGARSYYDSIGDSVVFAVRYDLGMVVYVASPMEEQTGHGKWHSVLQAAVAM